MEIRAKNENVTTKLNREFFMGDALELAKKLLGKVLVHETPYGTVRGIITETESYMGVEDKGSHTYGGRRTERTEPMFHIGGTSYVYFIYGMYCCMNVTANESDVPQAVLVRMVEPADEASEQIMLKLRMEDQERRAEKRCANKRKSDEGSAIQKCVFENGLDKAQERELEKEREKEFEKKRLASEKAIRKHLADGPGKLCIAMNISKADNDIDMVESDTFYLTEGIEVDLTKIQAGKRIGIDYAEEAADYLWRFTIDL